MAREAQPNELEWSKNGNYGNSWFPGRDQFWPRGMIGRVYVKDY